MTTHGVTINAIRPVREALLAAAERDAGHLQDDSETAVRRTLDEATAAAERVRSQARAQGAADATAALMEQRARSGQQARAVVLQAERENYEAVRTAAHAALPRLRGDADRLPLRQHMAVVVRRILGDDADLREAEDGGVIGTAPGRRIDCSLAWFMERAVDRVLAEERGNQGGERA